MQGRDIVEVGRLVFVKSDELLDQLKDLGYYIQRYERRVQRYERRGDIKCEGGYNVIDYVIFKEEEVCQDKKKTK